MTHGQPHPPHWPEGMTLSRLDSPVAIEQLLRDMQAQQSVATLFAISAADLAALAEPGPGTPLAHRLSDQLALLGLASLQGLDSQARRFRWRLGASVAAPPDALLAVSAMAGGVRVQQVLRGSWQADGPAWVLEADWPGWLLQWQRRRYPRITVPVGQSYSASFLFGKRRSTLDIDDFSQGGLALRGSRAETAMLFAGKKLPRVQLLLGDVAVQADLQVRARRSYQSFLLGEQVLAGCSIEAMDEADHDRLCRLLTRHPRPPQA